MFPSLYILLGLSSAVIGILIGIIVYFKGKANTEKEENNKEARNNFINYRSIDKAVNKNTVDNVKGDSHVS